MRCFCICFLLTIVLTLNAQEKMKIYLANDDHTDFIWTAEPATYHKAFLETLDYYLNLADETDKDTSGYQSRWNCDGSYWMWIYEKNRSGPEFERLISRIRDGHISVPLNALSLALGSTPAEAVIRGMYYPGAIERKYGISFPLAYQVENQTMAYGLGSLWAGAGAKYSWSGVCGCDTRVKGLNERDNYIYWWTGPDSSRILMKWYPLLDNNESAGGYAEARHSWPQEDRLLQSGKYPYKIAGFFGKGWDDLETLTREIITNAKMMSFNNHREVVVSNEIDFFKDFEEHYGNTIPQQSYGFGNEWELYSAYMQETTSRMLRSIARLRSAEALASLVSLKVNNFMDNYTTLRDSAWMSIGLFWDHDWGTTDRQCFVNERIQWQNHLVSVVERYVNTIYSDAGKRLGTLIEKPDNHKRFYVFNPLGNERTDIADLEYNGIEPFKIIDLSTGQEVQYDILNFDGEQAVRIIAEKIPPTGYKVYEIVPGKMIKAASAGKLKNNTLETRFYKLTIKENGAITSLIDKMNGNRELVKELNGRLLNDIGAGSGMVELVHSGSNSITVKMTSGAPLKHQTLITLYGKIPRIDIQNEINQNFSGTFYWQFGFNIKKPMVWHEEVGAVVKAAYPEEGGHYSHRNGRYDWLTLNHFADIGDDNSGITISSPDCNFMQVGNSTVDSIDTVTPVIKILAGTDTIAGSFGKPYISNQAGENHFLQRFALLPHTKFNISAAMKFSLEHQTPLVCGEITGGSGYPAGEFSLLQIEDPDVILWALKPAEDRIGKAGIVVRLWNMNDNGKNFRISSSGKISDAWKLTHIETPQKGIPIKNNVLDTFIGKQQLITLAFHIN